MPELVISDVIKSFGDTRVLNGIELSVRDGEFLTLVGPSGCGKSTLLRIIAGLETSDEGTVKIGERDVTGVTPAERDLAMVFQSYALYPHLTVSENMLVPLVQRDLSWSGRLPIIGPLLSRAARNEAKRRVHDVADTLKISPLLDRKPGQLSGGQRQRVALGRAMVRKPVAFLMDEPLSNLDAALRVHMRAELTDLHKSLARTFIYVTHDQAEALTMSDRMAVMWGGDILQLDTPQTIYDKPANLTVARFIGSPQINTLPAEIDADGRVTMLGQALARRVSPDRRGPATLGLRPEHLNISNKEDALLEGTLRFAENLGSDVYLHLSLADGACDLVLRATPAQAVGLSAGTKVYVGKERGEALVFGSDEAICDFVGTPRTVEVV